MREPDLVRRHAHRCVVAEMGIHHQQPAKSRRRAPGRDLPQRRDERLVHERERARPFCGVPGGDRVGEGRQHRHARFRRGVGARGRGDERVRANGQVWAVLFGRAERQQQHSAISLAELRYFRPRQFLEKHGARTRLGGHAMDDVSDPTHAVAASNSRAVCDSKRTEPRFYPRRIFSIGFPFASSSMSLSR